jgi:hypothetical protein
MKYYVDYQLKFLWKLSTEFNTAALSYCANEAAWWMELHVSQEMAKTELQQQQQQQQQYNNFRSNILALSNSLDYRTTNQRPP